jgi:CheY-like chemotaxis protein
VLRETYDVVPAESAVAALEILEETTRPFDILLTDLVMPRLSGRELARRVRERWPTIRILYMSGYDRDQLADGTDELLHKPFTLEELIRRIEALATA